VLLGAEVEGLFLVLLGLAMLYLVAKPSHVGADVDRASLPPAPSYCLWMAD
jgi:hypothetical protein